MSKIRIGYVVLEGIAHKLVRLIYDIYDIDVDGAYGGPITFRIKYLQN